MRPMAWLTPGRERQRRYMFERLYQSTLHWWKPPSVERTMDFGVKASVSCGTS